MDKIEYMRLYRRTEAFKSKARSLRRLNYEKLCRIKASPCVDCGIQYNPWVMHFDHRDPSLKVKGVSQMLERSWSAINKEISKCDLVCANCHAERTHKMHQQGLIKLGGRYVQAA